MLYLLLLKRSLAYMARPLSGVVRISVEEGRASNRLSGGWCIGGEELFCLDVDEGRTWDLASFTCLLVRISAKDILLSVDGTHFTRVHVSWVTGPTADGIIPESAVLLHTQHRRTPTQNPVFNSHGSTTP